MALSKDVEARLTVADKTYRYFDITHVNHFEKIPYALRVLLENVTRRLGGTTAGEHDMSAIVQAACSGSTGSEIEFMPARVLFQDFTGVPVMVDFAAMREAVGALGGDPLKVNPLIHCDLVIDHSIIGDVAGCPQARSLNEAKEFERNAERYRFLKWAQGSLQNLCVLPPASGICHQLDIERLAPGVYVDCTDSNTEPLVYFDTVVGTDSHTPTVGGIGILGWGVGGIEAEAASLGQPITLLVPKTYGIHMTGQLKDGISAMDLALTIAQILRERDVVGCYVEAFGDGVSTLSATMRTCVSNMSPEYGCTCLLFPMDKRTIEYYRQTGRSDSQVALIEAYAKAQGLWLTHDAQERVYADVIELDLGSVKQVIAGPSRPHERIEVAHAKTRVDEVTRAHGKNPADAVSVTIGDHQYDLASGAIAIAAITSCTTTADPAMLISAGLLARNACRRGLKAKPWVKRLLSPGSHASEQLLRKTGLLSSLQELGFYIAGFGCMSCIGNSGPIDSALHEVAGDIDLTAIVSGNRNFEGRISPDVSQNYLGSPATVVAYALAGTMSFDFDITPLGVDTQGRDVYLHDIWPSSQEVDALVSANVDASLYLSSQGDDKGSSNWQSLDAQPSSLYAWDLTSTYIRRPPYFDGMTLEPLGIAPITGARALLRLGDFITTDHISPAGSIALDSPAARYLQSKGVQPAAFNTYGARRGNHEVMERGTFANVKLRNLMTPDHVGCWALDQINDRETSVWDASCSYRDAHVPLVVIAGKMYGSGSSRDWAAKGPMLQGVRAVIAVSFERIHRSNLVGMGILPLQFVEGQDAETLGLDGTETYDIAPIDLTDAEDLHLPIKTIVTATHKDGSSTTFDVIVRVDTPTEAAYMQNGGILQYMVRRLAQ